MIDARLRRWVDPPLDALAAQLARTGVTANQVSIVGFAIGLGVIPLLAMQHYDLALMVIAANRVMDGLDGAVARRTQPTDMGGYLDIVLDFIFYGAVVFGFALGQPGQAIWGAFLLFSFFASGATFLAYAIFAAKHNLTTDIRGAKSFYYLGGLTEGFETIVAFALMCALPAHFGQIAMVFGAMCWMTGVSRLMWARRTLAIQRDR